MNTLGTLFRVSIFGESHGPLVGITIDGCPAGLPIDPNDFLSDLGRRRPGGLGTTTRVEEDIPSIVSGVFNGFTTGAPLTIQFANRNTQSNDYLATQSQHRPGHADFVLHKKFGGYNDYRGGGHSSGRLTLCIVAAGVVAKKMLGGISIAAMLEEAGGNSDIEAAIAQAIAQQDSIGGIVSCKVNNVPIGWGEPFFDSLESRISHAIFAIPAIKGIEFGAGFNAAKMFGSEHNDAIVDANGTTKTNNSGGINGGISNGNQLIFRVIVKPTSSTPAIQNTWNSTTQSVEPLAVKGRHDLCIALRVPVVVECMTAIVLADFLLQAKTNN